MLSTRIEEWEKQFLSKGLRKGLKEGIEKGMEKGIEKGKQLGEASMLCRLLERRYGPLPAWVDDKLSTANSDTLERWGLRFLETESLQALFESDTQTHTTKRNS